MKLIQALGFGSPVGLVLREAAQLKWHEWVARLYYSTSYQQYLFAYAKRAGVAEMIDGVSLDEGQTPANLRTYPVFGSPGALKRISDADLELVAKVARLIWADAIWGYTAGGWTMSSWSAHAWVQDRYGILLGDNSAQMPREYILLESWLEQLLVDYVRLGAKRT